MASLWIGKASQALSLLLLSIIFQGYSAISVSEEKDKVNPIFLNAVHMFFWWCTYLHHRAKYGRLPLFHRQTCRILYQSGHSGVHFRIRIRAFWFMALQSKDAKKSATSICAVSSTPFSGSVKAG